jgi:hypothetical protein
MSPAKAVLMVIGAGTTVVVALVDGTGSAGLPEVADTASTVLSD